MATSKGIKTNPRGLPAQDNSVRQCSSSLCHMPVTSYVATWQFPGTPLWRKPKILGACQYKTVVRDSVVCLCATAQWCHMLSPDNSLESHFEEYQPASLNLVRFPSASSRPLPLRLGVAKLPQVTVPWYVPVYITYLSFTFHPYHSKFERLRSTTPSQHQKAASACRNVHVVETKWRKTRCSILKTNDYFEREPYHRTNMKLTTNVSKTQKP